MSRTLSPGSCPPAPSAANVLPTPVAEAVRAKPDSSIAVLAELASPRKSEKTGTTPLDGMISAGNTGACVSAAQMQMRRLPGVHRPGIAVTVPTFAGPIVLIDVGANMSAKSEDLYQYGVMGAIYAETILGIVEPRVGLMNVGTEDDKLVGGATLGVHLRNGENGDEERQENENETSRRTDEAKHEANLL